MHTYSEIKVYYLDRPIYTNSFVYHLFSSSSVNILIYTFNVQVKPRNINSAVRIFRIDIGGS